MKLRPMNKTLVIELEDMIDVDCAKRERIILPEKNSVQKISDHARVIRAANDCAYPYKKNQRICYKHLDSTPNWYIEDGKKYRLIKEWDVHWVYEDD